MALDVRPYEFAYVFFDSNGQKIAENAYAVDGAQTMPSAAIGSTFEVLDAGRQVVGTVSDVRTFAQFDPNNMRYRVSVICRDSHLV
ncbi:MAG: hypothetical protein F9K19_23370 [Rhizobiaceae bacterium]|nr:MAG: hypothetical protein F9K19_23370 [Rhizobiaceae bacterium]CAG1012073.1 hypothetical protein RHIZO_04180 [Rhizobiaceae bacterium]